MYLSIFLVFAWTSLCLVHVVHVFSNLVFSNTNFRYPASYIFKQYCSEDLNSRQYNSAFKWPINRLCFQLLYFESWFIMIFLFVCFVIHFHGLILTFLYCNFHEIHIKFKFIELQTFISPYTHISLWQGPTAEHSLSSFVYMSLIEITHTKEWQFLVLNFFFFSHTSFQAWCKKKQKKPDSGISALKRQGVQGGGA